jgi:cob(I)alamin adenosyltransferase
MSIVTRTGDTGTTGLMYNRRVPKSHARVEAYGTVDELNAALGTARAAATHDFLKSTLLAIQKDLVLVMGELATHPTDLARYITDGFQTTGPDLIARLDQWVGEVESQGISYKGWATPGATPEAAALDVARTTCRRAERRVHALHDVGEPPNPDILIFLNRLSDLLWLLARWVETRAEETSPG